LKSSHTARFVATAVLAAALGLGPAVLQAAVWVPEGTAHTASDTPAEQEAKMGWWREARFGMFIHWGLYSVPAGQWKGRKVGNLGEWILKQESIPVAEYKALAWQFNPTQFNATEWVAIAKNAGMKYIVITAKHHDGFAMFRSKADPFNIYDATPFKRDPLQELATACQKAGMRFGFYYSHDQDWTTPGGAVIGKTWDKEQQGDFTEYLRKKSLPQFKELLSNYQPAPDILWFDTPTTDMTPDLAKQFVSLLKQHPKLIWNERLGGGYKGNFRTPENQIPASGLSEDWEVCMTVNDTWGYKADDHRWKSTEVLVRNLIDVASKGGNYLLNVGPTAQGLIPGPSLERLTEVGKWLKVNGESIYGSTAASFNRQPAWGRFTRKGNTLYLHVFDWPSNGRIVVPVSNLAIRAHLLAAPDAPLTTASTADGLEIQLPGSAPDRIASVIEVTLDGPLQKILPIPVSQAADGTLVLTASAAEIYGSSARLESGEVSNIGYWSDPHDYLEWTINVTRPGLFAPTLNYSCGIGSAGGEIALMYGGETVKGTVESTGNWENYLTATLGQVRLEKGTNTVVLKALRKKGDAIMNLRSITFSPPAE
jgi:alpha-L-fucosidase